MSYFVLKKYLIAKNISLLIIVAYFSFYRFFFFIAFFCFKAFHNSSCLLFFMIFINVFFYLFLPVLQTKTVVFFKHFTMSLFFLFSFFFFWFISFILCNSFIRSSWIKEVMAHQEKKKKLFLRARQTIYKWVTLHQISIKPEFTLPSPEDYKSCQHQQNRSWFQGIFCKRKTEEEIRLRLNYII